MAANMMVGGYRLEDRFGQLDNSVKIDMLKKMYQVRHFEQQTEQFIIRGMIHGTCHLCIGQEATAIGAISAAGREDYITSTHRGHGHCIGKGADLKLMMAELLGKSTGYCRGRGGSMHIADLDSGNLGANGIVGGGLGIAAGAALTCKLKFGNRKVVLCFFGDGAANQGIFHESLNLASIWDLPVIYICENNVYGMSTPTSYAFNINRISDRKLAYGIDGLTIDGNDLGQVYNTIYHFAQRCRLGKGPVLVEAVTYRWKGHSKSDAQVYRSKQEVRSWMAKDPIARYLKYLKQENILSQQQAGRLEKQVARELAQAVEFALESPFPDPEQVEEDVYYQQEEV